MSEDQNQSKVHSIVPLHLETETDVRPIIEGFLERADHFQGVMLIGLNKDGSQFLQTSTMSAMEKTFLLAFANAFAHSWFCTVPMERPPPP